MEERHIFSPTLVNLARVSFSRPVETAVQDSPQVLARCSLFRANRTDAWPLAGTTIGPFMLLPYFLVPNHFIEGDDIIWTHGSHSIRAGVSVERVDDNPAARRRLGGTYTFNSLLTCLQAATRRRSRFRCRDRPIRSAGSAPRISLPISRTNGKSARRLTLNLGLRYECGTDPTEKHNLCTISIDSRTELCRVRRLDSVPAAFGRNITSTGIRSPRRFRLRSVRRSQDLHPRRLRHLLRSMLTGRDILPAYWLAPPFNLGSATEQSGLPESLRRQRESAADIARSGPLLLGRQPRRW